MFALFRPPINGARRWIPLGVTQLQPSELLKVALVVLLAHQLARKTEKAGDPERALIPALVFSGVAAAVVVLQPDLGTAVCYVMLCAVLLWLAGARARWFAFGALAILPMLAALMLSADYRRARILSFLNPEADPLGTGFQAIQSLIAVGAGGWFGNGLGGSRQKLFFLPYPAHRLHLRDRGRGARIHRRARRRGRALRSWAGAACARPGARRTPSPGSSPPARRR